MKSFTQFLNETKRGLSIGTLVKFKRNVGGYQYGTVRGFVMAKGAKAVPGLPGPVGKVSRVIIEKKKSPLAKNDYYGTKYEYDFHSFGKEFDVVQNERQEIDDWVRENGHK